MDPNLFHYHIKSVSYETFHVSGYLQTSGSQYEKKNRFVEFDSIYIQTVNPVITGSLESNNRGFYPVCSLQGCPIWHPNWVRLAPHGTNLGLLKISFSIVHFCSQVPDLSRGRQMH